MMAIFGGNWLKILGRDGILCCFRIWTLLTVYMSLIQDDCWQNRYISDVLSSLKQITFVQIGDLAKKRATVVQLSIVYMYFYLAHQGHLGSPLLAQAHLVGIQPEEDRYEDMFIVTMTLVFLRCFFFPYQKSFEIRWVFKRKYQPWREKKQTDVKKNWL